MSAPEQAEFTFLPLGAIIQEFRVGGKNIVLGFPTQEHYEKYNTAHYGATIGRVANRIKNGLIQNLNGKEYQLTTNNGPNALHGGEKGWGKRVFDGPHTVKRHDRDALLFKYRHVDGEEKYPGTVEVRVWYTASKEGDAKTVLTVEYEVEFVGDECEETVVNITNHSYFNIGDGPTISGTTAQLATQDYLPLDDTGIPHGTIDKFPRDVTNPFELVATGAHIDDVFVMETDPSKIPLDTRDLPVRRLAEFSNANTGLHLEVHSTEPAFQFYTGKYINIPSIDGAAPHTEGAGFCVEPSRYVNAINEPEWRKMVLLKKGQIFGCKNVYKAWKE
ncbi:Glycoside hydrolase-type carbohydrate-binding subgroup [Penicillium atrosanguineum]|uniref:Glycoside hydrolase-type carbohydrate-binding subgroup n=1 Tax=Penicillium atrosanguineum TaxID=1132637 RepID=A0A9W9PNH3_9EURO|nr:Glycoside hydrolase-type carbohydrate-binding subgroup [Penicillium atrosanguineum]KAJ5299364.1 Glycoside hydrolase-type carbohydrate-binding subgroup [Penicillium atrosanguineum]